MRVDGQPNARVQRSEAKASPKFVSMILKAVIMSVVTSIFFLFLGVAAILLLNLCLAGGTLRRRFRSHQPHPSNGLSPQDLSNLPHLLFLGSDKECVVCLDSINHGQSCRELPACTHLFHRRCVDKWLLKVAACPICRAPVRLDSAHQLSLHTWTHR